MGAGHAHTLYVHGHSRIHRLAPEIKVASAFSVVVAVAITPREAFWAFAVYGILLAAVTAVARVPIGFLILRLTAVLPFVAFSFLIPFIASGSEIDVLGLTVSVEGLWSAWNILVKAILGATTSILLVATTEVSSILQGMGKLKVPQVFISIAGFMVRYLELIADELGRMRNAMRARGYDPRWVWQVGPFASAAGVLFIRSYERSERVHAAMISRGYHGSMPDLGSTRARPADWVVAAIVPVAAVVVAVTALVIPR
jgi:cobalt/nickel transport system permease protein